MTLRSWVNLRISVLVLLWLIPILIYVPLGLMAMYRQGWLGAVTLSLPIVWLVAWLVGKLWRPTRLNEMTRGVLLQAPDFWTPRDAAAIAIVEQYRAEAADVDRNAITSPTRYQQDAEELAERLAEHYYGKQRAHAFTPVTTIEILAVIHLAVEDLEEWVLQNVPGSEQATIGHLSRLSQLASTWDGIQKIAYIASAVFNPGKLLAYPLWRKSGRVTLEIQNELIRGFYQRYLGLIGYYLIEMYSGRLKGGAKQYRARFGPMAKAVHASGGEVEQLRQLNDVATTIAVMGQVKAGKSSLINALLGNDAAPVGILPQTRRVERYEYPIPGSQNVVTLLDTPGYDEADVTPQQLRDIATASESADLLLLVLAANVTARQADLAMVRRLDEHYHQRPHLKPPVIVAVLTHIDLLRPVREWSPPYDWQSPTNLKEQSIAGSVDYVRELFGTRISGYACVYTGNTHASDSSVTDELVPLIVQHLHQGKMVAILKAFHKQLSSQRFQRLLQQTLNLLKHISLEARL